MRSVLQLLRKWGWSLWDSLVELWAMSMSEQWSLGDARCCRRVSFSYSLRWQVLKNISWKNKPMKATQRGWGRIVPSLCLAAFQVELPLKLGNWEWRCIVCVCSANHPLSSDDNSPIFLGSSAFCPCGSTRTNATPSNHRNLIQGWTFNPRLARWELALTFYLGRDLSLCEVATLVECRSGRASGHLLPQGQP